MWRKLTNLIWMNLIPLLFGYITLLLQQYMRWLMILNTVTYRVDATTLTWVIGIRNWQHPECDYVNSIGPFSSTSISWSISVFHSFAFLLISFYCWFLVFFRGFSTFWTFTRSPIDYWVSSSNSRVGKMLLLKPRWKWN